VAAGRPRKPKAIRKDAHLNIRLTAQQRATIGKAAAKAGISASSWVVLVALREAGQ
jgi:uncharacterized protein (DUF1778 family)